MRGSYKLFKLFGIGVFVHWTFIFLPIYVLITELNLGIAWADAWLPIAFVLLIFVCVTLHEFGHALMARKYGIKTSDINLLPIGGVARIENMPENPKQEFWIAIAGPLVNVGIALLIALGYLLIYGNLPFMGEAQVGEEITHLTPLLKSHFAELLIETNLFLVIFNMIPAYPLDGGRVLRSLLAMKLGHSKSTMISTVISQVVSVIFIVVGLYFGQFFLAIIGVFVLMSARSEFNATRYLSKLSRKKLSVEQFANPEFPFVYENEVVESTLEYVKTDDNDSFVVMSSSREIVGLVTTADLLSEENTGKRVTDIMQKEWQNIQQEQTVQEVYQIMSSKMYGMLPVYNGNKVIGTVLRKDLETLSDIGTQGGN